jgi:tRNA(Ile)-lysidine synthase
LLDASTIEAPLILRRWKTGDYFYPLGMEMKKKKISRVLINEKVPLHIKETTFVLESNQRIAWLAGIRMDERFKVRPHTGKILKITRSKLNTPTVPLPHHNNAGS